MSLVNKVICFVENVVDPITGRISSQRHIIAIKDGFMATMPFLIVGSLLLVLAFPPGDSNAFLAGWTRLVEIVGKDNILAPFHASMGIFALYVAFSIGFNLAESYGLRPLNSGFLSMFAFLLAVIPISSFDKGLIPLSNIGGTGAFTAILVGLLVPELQRFLQDKRIGLRLPDAVPSKVSASFDLLIPIVIIAFAVMCINILLEKYGLTIPSAIIELFKPLVSVSDSFVACLLAVVLIHLLWFGGIHGSSIVITGVLYPILLINLDANQEALVAGQELPKIFVSPLLDSFVLIGGAGSTWGLVLLMMSSKSAHLKTIGKMSIVPGTFNINEPVIFGAPIVMNPTYFIPWMLSPMVNTCVVWLAFKMDCVSKIIALPPWTMPAPISAVMATNSGTAAIVVLLCIALSAIIYYPFFKIHEKQLLEEELVEESATELAVAK